ncbi:hypothetical protein TNCV_4628281 [Trichonephila clavipes]|nr:hypothetical protein TNCV_4628281 [Trichonephila clavipes]
MCPEDLLRHVWRQSRQSADPAFTIARHIGPPLEVIVWGALSFEAGPLWSSLELVEHILDQPNHQIPLQSSMFGIGWEGNCFYQGMLMNWPDNWSKFGKKYLRRPSGCFITLCHVVWQLSSILEMSQILINDVTL